MSEYVAIDFETANERPSSVCALGVAVVSGTELIRSKAWLIKPPEVYFRPFNTRLHGISHEHVEEEPEFFELWDEIWGFVGGRRIIAHNANFDIGVLRAVLRVYGIPEPRLRYSCTVTIARKVWPTLGRYRLNAVAGHLGIDFRHHHAGDDALVCAEIARRACIESGADSLSGLIKQLGVQTYYL